jgi:hypothetical protein
MNRWMPFYDFRDQFWYAISTTGDAPRGFERVWCANLSDAQNVCQELTERFAIPHEETDQ